MDVRSSLGSALASCCSYTPAIMVKSPLCARICNPSWYLQDDFLDSLHAQNMESHEYLLAEIGVDTADIPAPDLCLLGVFMGSIGEAYHESNVPLKLKSAYNGRAPLTTVATWGSSPLASSLRERHHVHQPPSNRRLWCTLVNVGVPRLVPGHRLRGIGKGGCRSACCNHAQKNNTSWQYLFEELSLPLTTSSMLPVPSSHHNITTRATIDIALFR